jgi:hypothetical protein
MATNKKKISKDKRSSFIRRSIKDKEKRLKG